MSEWKAEALRLREAEGLSVRHIAARVGRSHGTVGELFKPHYCGCGNVRMHHRSRCRACHDADRRLAVDQRLELIAGMYNDGRLLREIAEAVYGPSDLSLGAQTRRISPDLDLARKRGLIGYRVAEDDGRRRVAA